MVKINQTAQPPGKSGRIWGLDALRGITLISMAVYHGMWDLVYLFGLRADWYNETPGYLWQQSICWCFILLSGFCWGLGRKPLKRGLMVFGGGALVTAVTVLVMPAERVVFGVLTLIGSAMLLMIPLHTLFRKIPAQLAPIGALASVLLFFLTRNVARGSFGFEGIRLGAVPEAFYQNYLTAYFGFPPDGFYSTDYFPLLPWFFLFLTGYFIFRAVSPLIRRKKESGGFSPAPAAMKPFCWIGRHSLILYLLHQPVIYGVFQLIQMLL